MSHRVRGMGILREEEFGGVRMGQLDKHNGNIGDAFVTCWMWSRESFWISYVT